MTYSTVREETKQDWEEVEHVVQEAFQNAPFSDQTEHELVS